MNKLFLLTKPELFQGKKYLKNIKDYFEGWYFKNSANEKTISFIPGISISEKKKNAFIQIITNTNSYFINYDIKDFKFNNHPFSVQIKNNFFSTEKIHIDINELNLKIKGDIKYFNHTNIKTSLLNPNIMGPFSYIPFMECNHAILSMKNNIKGLIKINNQKIKFKSGIGYIEKDWGCSFPKSYIWLQGNKFHNKNTSFMLSMADIPFKIFQFRGIICILIINGKEYRFTTYNNTKLIKYNINNNQINIVLRKEKYTIIIKAQYDKRNKLVAPVKGKMKKDILESISSKITVTLKKKNQTIFSAISKNCGLEIVDY